jgi:hypothetical protein
MKKEKKKSGKKNNIAKKKKSKLPTLGGSLTGLGGTGAQGTMP